MKAGIRTDLQAASVTDTAGLEALANEWSELADACQAATIFQTFEWNRTWWEHFGRKPGRRLHIVTFRTDGLLVGLAPLLLDRWYGGPLRILRFLGAGASDYLDILARRGCERQVVAAFNGYLACAGGWEVADLQQLREGALLRYEFSAEPTGPSEGVVPARMSPLRHHDAPQEECPYLELAGDWPAVLSGLGKKTRYNIGYYTRNVEKTNEVQFGCACAADLDDEMTNLFELHQRRWNKRWLPGVFGGGRVQDFHRDVARALLERGWLRLFHLRLDGATEACLYCFSFGDRLCYYQGGFEPSLAKLSLGTVLTARAIQVAVDEHKTVFDFLRGDEPYKAKWTSTSRRNMRRIMVRHWLFYPQARMVQMIEDAVEKRLKALARRLR